MVALPLLVMTVAHFQTRILNMPLILAPYTIGRAPIDNMAPISQIKILDTPSYAPLHFGI